MKNKIALRLSVKVGFFCHSEISLYLKSCHEYVIVLQKNVPLFPNGNISHRIASTFHCGLPFGACGIHQESSILWVCPVEETPVTNSNSQLLYNFVEMYECII